MKLPSFHTAILASLIIILLGSMAANIFLLKRSRHYARLFHTTRLDPLGLETYPMAQTQPDTQDTAHKLVVFFGDSRAYQWGTPDQHGRWHFVNRGVNGQSSVQAALRFDAHIPALQPDVVVIQVGANDLNALTYLAGDRDHIIAVCKQHTELIVKKAVDAGATVIVTTIFPIGDDPVETWFFAGGDIPSAVDEVNHYLMTLASDNVIIFNTAAILADEQGFVRREYREDYLHINQAGYTALQNALLRILDTIPVTP